MLANKDSTSPIMLRALALTSNALDAAFALDVDRTADDQAFFRNEKALVDRAFDDVYAAAQAVQVHDLRESRKHQARVVVGDAVLDRGVRAGKKRVTLEKGLEVADTIFEKDINEIVGAERHVEPQLVLQCVDKLVAAADFRDRDAVVNDLKGRAERQIDNFALRTAAERVEASLDATLEAAISGAADVLYTLEKRLLERFPRDKVYVAAFFLDVGWKRKKTSEG